MSNYLKLALGLAMGFQAVLVVAQPAEPVHPVGTNSTINLLTPPAPPPVKSPVELFRDLLAMSPAERDKVLAGRSAESRKLVLDKIREYRSMSPEQRELRLNVTELRWYLWPLMKMDATNRAPRLESYPGEMRKMVEARLRIWDIVPPPLQKELLQNEATARCLSEIAAGIVAATNVAPEVLKAWGGMPEQNRREISQLFDQFFGLTTQEQQKVLRRLSPQEHRQIEKTLQLFANLPPRQRSKCIRSYEQFTGLGPEERKQFLENVDLWEKMAPHERQAFRDLVQRLSMEPPTPIFFPRIPPPPGVQTHRLPNTVTNN
jgi:hypothetical protein